MSGDRDYVPRNHAMSAVRQHDNSSLDDDEVRTEPPIPREPRTSGGAGSLLPRGDRGQDHPVAGGAIAGGGNMDF